MPRVQLNGCEILKRRSERVHLVAGVRGWRSGRLRIALVEGGDPTDPDEEKREGKREDSGALECAARVAAKNREIGNEEGRAQRDEGCACDDCPVTGIGNSTPERVPRHGAGNSGDRGHDQNQLTHNHEQDVVGLGMKAGDGMRQGRTQKDGRHLKENAGKNNG